MIMDSYKNIALLFSGKTGVQRKPASRSASTSIRTLPIKRPLQKAHTPEAPVIIVGGGLAGITAAYQLQKKGRATVVLETAPRIGGNAKTGYRTYTEGDVPKKQPYPIGASVLAVANQEQRDLFSELGIDVSNPKYTIHTDVAYFDGEWVSIDPAQVPEAQAKRAPWVLPFVNETQQFIQFLRNILRTRDGKTHFPLQQAPHPMFAWDKLSMAEVFDGWSHRVRDFFTLNLRSDVANDMHRLSGLAGIIDQGADMGERCVLPGGNFYLIRKMTDRIRQNEKKGLPKVQIIRDAHVEAVVDPGLKPRQKPPFSMGPRAKKIQTENTPNPVKVSYRDAKGKLHQLNTSHVLLALPSHKIPPIVPGLIPDDADFLTNIKRGSYALMNLYLDEAPVQSHTYFKFPYAKWAADAILNNAPYDPELPVGSKAPVVITTYIGITEDMRKDGLPKPNVIMKEAIAEMSVAWPWLKDKIKGARITFYPDAMSAPAPGQMTQIRDFNPQLTPHIRSIHSDLSGVFAARGAIDQALRGVDAVLEKEQKKTALTTFA
ncbi:MAG: FAD-dependent oxidoreductase [Cyanobacteria bacterium]|nr:FAD-dependent oxidoreductase [Cyanobacteriota bacterium]